MRLYSTAKREQTCFIHVCNQEENIVCLCYFYHFPKLTDNNLVLNIKEVKTN